MTRIFVYEHLTCGGLLEDPDSPESLLREGAAMLCAVVEDFLAAGCEVQLLLSNRVHGLLNGLSAKRGGCDAKCLQIDVVESASQCRARFGELAAAADWTLVIAPETNGTLTELHNIVRQSGGRILGVSKQVCELASSKSLSADFLAARGVLVPHGVQIQVQHNAAPGAQDCQQHRGTWTDFPAILKPDDGCGSIGVQRVASNRELLAALLSNQTTATDRRLERYISGIAASVSVILSPRDDMILPACYQHLGGDCGLEFHGSSHIKDCGLADRATRLARQVVQALRSIDEGAPSLGWLGIDVVLGGEGPMESPSRCEQQSPVAKTPGTNDVVIEINPRLTSSYLTLRSRANLAAAMLSAAESMSQTPA